MVSDNIDILVIAETILYSTFTTAQFCIDEFQKPLRYDRNAHGGCLINYIRDSCPGHTALCSNFFFCRNLLPVHTAPSVLYKKAEIKIPEFKLLTQMDETISVCLASILSHYYTFVRSD